MLVNSNYYISFVQPIYPSKCKHEKGCRCAKCLKQEKYIRDKENSKSK